MMRPQIPLGVTARKSERKYRDPIFAVLYILCMLVFIISGIIIALTTNVSSRATAYTSWSNSY